MDRRHLLGLGAAATGALLLPRRSRAQGVGLIPIRVQPDQIFRVTVCLRPFRAAGPRIETETLGRKTVVHNYGHGGSGWSLSWGSAAEAVRLAMQQSPKTIAVVGAGALGLTAAITAQRAGAKVTVYARERFPFVRSARATGSWTPDSRIAMRDAVTSGFPDFWERMARVSYSMHQSFLSLPGNPVEFVDQYSLHTPRPVDPNAPPPPPDPGFLHMEGRLDDIEPDTVTVDPATTPFSSPNVSRTTTLSFNVADYAHQLTQDFLEAGGTFVPMTFNDPSELRHLKEPVIINCTGYGARALWKDDSIVPVRGQIAWLPPQEYVHYGFYYHGVLVLARRDGVVVQDLGSNGEMFGYNDDNETPDMDAARAAVAKLDGVYRT